LERGQQVEHRTNSTGSLSNLSMNTWLREGGWIAVLGTLLVTALVSGCRGSLPVFVSKPDPRVFEESHQYRVHSGDLLQLVSPNSIKVYAVRVAPDGTIDLPSFGVFNAAGRTIDDLRTELINKDPLLAKGSLTFACDCFEYFVSGEVKRPGPKLWSSGTTVSRAISAAGGVTEPGQQTVTLAHPDGSMEVIDWPPRSRLLAILIVLAGDHVIVNSTNSMR
jgi:protein involved in polysaccharide export with SLBB domain